MRAVQTGRLGELHRLLCYKNRPSADVLDTARSDMCKALILPAFTESSWVLQLLVQKLLTTC